MPVSAPNPPSQIAPTKSTLGAVVKDSANKLRYDAPKTADAQTYAKMFGSTADALGTLQKELDQIVNQLQTPLPQADEIQISDSTGNLVVDIGDFVDLTDNIAYNGIWAKNMWIGGSGPATAAIVADSSGVTINNVKIVLTGPAGTITLDPTVPDINVASSSTTAYVNIIPGAIVVSAANATTTPTPGTIVLIGELSGSTPFPQMELAPGGITIQNASGLATVVSMAASGHDLESGTMQLIKSDGSVALIVDTSSVTAAPVSIFGGSTSQLFMTQGRAGFGGNTTAGYAVDATGDVNVSGVYRVGGTAGISVIRTNETVSYTSVTNGVFGTPGAGQSNGTVVTGLTVTVAFSTFTGGILTA